MNTEDEIRFLRTYKDFIYFFNILEGNLGYCLRYCLSKKGNQNPEKWLSASFDSKIKRVMALAKQHGVSETFSVWHTEVQACRHVRNIVSHGYWEWKWWLPEPIYFHAPEIENGEGQFTMEEFQLKLVYLKNVSEKFHTIRTILERAVVSKAKPVVVVDE